MPQRLTLDQLTDLKNDPRMQNPQVRAQVYAKVDPVDRAWLEQQTASDTAPDYAHLPQQLAGQAVDYARENPRKTGAMIGGVVAPALVTGGASLPVSLLASFLGGAGGAGVGMTADATHQYFGGAPSSETLPSSPLDTAKLMGQEGATQVGADLAGRGLGATIKGGANLLMNETVPAEIAKDFAGVNIGETLNRYGINPTTTRGATKARLLRRTAGQQTQQLAADATRQGTPGITRRDVSSYLGPATKQATEDASAGIPGGHGTIERRVDALFDAQFPYGDIPLESAPGVTRSLQQEGKIVRKQLSADKPPTDIAGITADNLAAGVRQTTGAKVPGYADANRTTQELIAAAQAASKMSKMPLRIGGWPSRVASATMGGGALASGHPLEAVAATALPLALGTPAISAPAAISLYYAGKLPYALLLKVIGPEVAQASGITDPGGR